MLDPNTQLETHPAGVGNLNLIVNGNWTNIMEAFNPAAGLTFSQSTTNVTASSAFFTSDMVGATIRFASGALAVITAFTNSTTVVVTPSQTVTPAQAASLYRTDQVLRTTLARGLMKLHRITSGEDGKTIVWSNTLQKFVFSAGGIFAQGTLTYAASVALDFDSNSMQTVSLTGAITFTTSNKAAGRRKLVRIVCDGTGRAFTFPGWKFVGAAAPASIAASKTAILLLDCFGTSESDVVARYHVEP